MSAAPQRSMAASAWPVAGLRALKWALPGATKRPSV
jgi:hypothetical protein